jgi:hypothetical protein
MSVPVEIEDITVPNNYETKKTLYSQWHVLVASNVRTDNLEVANRLADCLKDGFRTAFETRPTEIFLFMKGGSWDSEFIDGMKIQYAAEVGEKSRIVHLHALVTVTHHSNVRINGKALQEILREHCQDEDIKNIFVRVKWVPTSRPLVDYIGKNPLSREGGGGL